MRRCLLRPFGETTASLCLHVPYQTAVLAIEPGCRTSGSSPFPSSTPTAATQSGIKRNITSPPVVKTSPPVLHCGSSIGVAESQPFRVVMIIPHRSHGFCIS